MTDGARRLSPGDTCGHPSPGACPEPPLRLETSLRPATAKHMLPKPWGVPSAYFVAVPLRVCFLPTVEEGLGWGRCRSKWPQHI